MGFKEDYFVLIDLLNRHNLNTKTNWSVMTGPPSSGKSSSLKLLKESGYKINPDISREYLTKQKKSGNIVSKDSLYSLEMQKKLFFLMTKDALSLDIKENILHDYSLPDNIAFLRLGGLNVPDEILRSAKIFKFKEVFIFEPLKFVPDEIRTEDKDDQMRLFELIKESYLELGYKPIIVKRNSLEKRHDFILNSLQQNSV